MTRCNSLLESERAGAADADCAVRHNACIYVHLLACRAYGAHLNSLVVTQAAATTANVANYGDFFQPSICANKTRDPSTDHVKKLRIMVRGGRWVNVSSLFSAAEKSPPSDDILVLSLAVDCKFSVPLYLFHALHRWAMSRTVSDAEIDWISFAKEARVQLRCWKDGTLSRTST